LWLLVVVVVVRKEMVAGQAVAVLAVIEQAQHPLIQLSHTQ
jgi:hypothetical protein